MNPCVRCSSACAIQPTDRLSIHKTEAPSRGIPTDLASMTSATAIPGRAELSALALALALA